VLQIRGEAENFPNTIGTDLNRRKPVAMENGRVCLTFREVEEQPRVVISSVGKCRSSLFSVLCWLFRWWVTEQPRKF